jgi:cytochrome c oxidase subunit II
MLKFLNLPPAASAHASEIDHVLGLEHWMMAALFVLWAGYFVFVLMRFRRRANPRADYTGMKSYWSVYLVFVVALAEGVLLVAYELPFWRERTAGFPRGNDVTTIRVVAEQFNWNVHYPGPDGRFGSTDVTLVAPENPLGLDRRDAAAADDVTTLNQLTVPVGRPVLIRLTSKDVIHSFGVHEMRVKQDATPGVDTPVWFIPTMTTAEMRARLGKADFDYEIACSQLCGLGHFRMRGILTVTTDAEYRAFLAEEARTRTR